VNNTDSVFDLNYFRIRALELEKNAAVKERDHAQKREEKLTKLKAVSFFYFKFSTPKN
jgi:hypothetical protein